MTELEEEIKSYCNNISLLNTEHIKQRCVKYKKRPNRTSRDKKYNVWINSKLNSAEEKMSENEDTPAETTQNRERKKTGDA